MQYQVVTSPESDLYASIHDVEKKVNELCKEGWKPQGGISIVLRPFDYGSDSFYVFQAMIKED